MTKSETIIDLIARALGMTEPAEMERLQSYLELYVSTLAPMKKREESPPSANDSKIEPANKSTLKTEQAAKTGHFNQKDAPIVATNAKTFSGEGAGEKKAALIRLQNYREKNGLGCYKTITERSKGALTEDEIRNMINAAPYHISKWRALAAALDAIGA